MTSPSKTLLIAPCGINCAVCVARLRESRRCPGCRVPDPNKPVTRLRCKIKTCDSLQDRKAKFCFECERFPCDRLNHMDERYRSRYNISVVENLENIREHGIGEFLVSEEVRWTCPSCGGTICLHTRHCMTCSYERLLQVANLSASVLEQSGSMVAFHEDPET